MPHEVVVPAKKKSPAALDIADLVRLLAASGSKCASTEHVRADLEAGAPTNAALGGDCTINLVHYGAWLARQVASQETSRGN